MTAADRHIQQLELLAGTLAEVGAALDVHSALAALGRGAIRVLAGDQGAVRLYDPSGSGHVAYWVTSTGALEPDYFPEPPPGSVAAQLKAGGPARIIADLWDLDPDLPTGERERKRRGMRSSVAVPITAAEQCLGSLHVDHHQPGAFAQTDLALAQALAAQAGAVVARIRAEEARERAAAERSVAVERLAWLERERAAREQAEALAAENARLYKEAQEQASAQALLNAALREMAEARDKALADAQEALRLREQFLASAAHELRTPMTSLRGYAQLLQRQLTSGRRPDPARAGRALRLIDLQSIRLSRLIRQLIDLSRTDSEGLTLSRDETEIVGLVESVLAEAQEMLEVTAPAAAVRHSFSLDAPAPIVGHVDRERLEQVLAALVENAVKYSPAGGTVEVSVKRNGTGHARIAVRDHGVGVPFEDRERLFQRFFQSPLRAAVGGMGLNLFIGREIALLHGGSLDAEFPDDGGACFVLTIPLEPVPEHSPNSGEAPAGAGADVSSAPQWNAYGLESSAPAGS